MAKFFRFPWADSGDKTAIPDPTDVSGYVSYQIGYGADYERDPATDPLSKAIERNKMNQLFNDVTSNIRHYQTNTYPEYITSADNGGTAFAYDVDAIVRYDAGAGYKLYRNTTAANTNIPTGAGWVLHYIGEETHIATSKTTPVDADEIPLSDSAASFGLKKLTWANLKALLYSSPTFTGTVSGLPDASTTAKGVSELATSAETIAGTDATRTVTPAGIQAKFTDATTTTKIDTTTGKLLKVGDFGVGADSYTNMYLLTSDAAANSMSLPTGLYAFNYPASSFPYGYGYIEVTGLYPGADYNWASQIFHSLGGRKYTRYGTALNTWTAWTEILTVANVNSIAPVLGVGQTWQDLYSSRAFGTTYTNSTGSPIMISVTALGNADRWTLVVDSLTIGYSNIGSSEVSTLTAIVPNGSSYSATSTVALKYSWKELR